MSDQAPLGAEPENRADLLRRIERSAGWDGRIQVFDLDGSLLEIWSGLGKPCGLYLTGDDTLSVADADGGTITIAKNGQAAEVIEELGRPHWIGRDPSRALYVDDVRAMRILKIVKQ